MTSDRYRGVIGLTAVRLNSTGGIQGVNGLMRGINRADTLRRHVEIRDQRAFPRGEMREDAQWRYLWTSPPGSPPND